MLSLLRDCADILPETGDIPDPVFAPLVTGRQLVEYDSLAVAAVAGFDAAVAAGVPDTAAGFCRFAGETFDRQQAFLARWDKPEEGRIVVRRESFRADPGPWLLPLLALVFPGAPLPGDAAVRRLTQRAADWFAARPAPDLTGFRHHDPSLFEMLGRFRLQSRNVREVFYNTMGRDVSDLALPRFQTHETVQSLRDALKATPEYTTRQAIGTPKGGRAVAAPPPSVPSGGIPHDDVIQAYRYFLGRGPKKTELHHASVQQMHGLLLNSPEYRASPRARKTNHGWPLAQVFVSREARVLYCPIGKVACTFLKRQIARLSPIPYQERTINDIHVLTDRVNTGLQLGDYDRTTAQKFIDAPHFFKFAVLRDPADRLLSAYVEKFFLNRHSPPNNLLHTHKVVGPVQRAKGLAEPDFDLGITFRDFVTHITSVPPRTLDPHWIPQVFYLEGIEYDRIFGFEDLDAVIDILEQRSGQTLPRQAQNVTGSGSGENRPGAADLLPAELAALPRLDKLSFFDAELDRTIRDYFAEDYELLARA